MAKRCTEQKSTTAADSKRVYTKIVYHTASAAHYTLNKTRRLTRSPLSFIPDRYFFLFIMRSYGGWAEKILSPLYGVDVVGPHSAQIEQRTLHVCKSANKRGLYTSTTETAAHKNRSEWERTRRKIIHRRKYPQQLCTLCTATSMAHQFRKKRYKLKNLSSMGLVAAQKISFFSLSFYFSFIFS